MQHHAADQLHVEVAHVEHAAAGFADDGEGFRQDLIEDFVDGLELFIFNLLEAFGIGVRLVGNLAHAVLNSCRGIRRFWRAAGHPRALHLGLERVDRLDAAASGA